MARVVMARVTTTRARTTARIHRCAATDSLRGSLCGSLRGSLCDGPKWRVCVHSCCSGVVASGRRRGHACGAPTSTPPRLSAAATAVRCAGHPGRRRRLLAPRRSPGVMSGERNITLATHGHSWPLVATHHSSLIAHRSSLVAHRSSLIAHRSSLITHHSSLITQSDRLVTRRRVLTRSRRLAHLAHPAHPAHPARPHADG